MKTFKYFAVKKDGTKVEGKIEAETEKEAQIALFSVSSVAAIPLVYRC